MHGTLQLFVRTQLALITLTVLPEATCAGQLALKSVWVPDAMRGRSWCCLSLVIRHVGRVPSKVSTVNGEGN